MKKGRRVHSRKQTNKKTVFKCMEEREKIQSTCGTETSPGGLGIEHEGQRGRDQAMEVCGPSKGTVS